jgi:predicted phage-related endonuclease
MMSSAREELEKYLSFVMKEVKQFKEEVETLKRGIAQIQSPYTKQSLKDCSGLQEDLERKASRMYSIHSITIPYWLKEAEKSLDKAKEEIKETEGQSLRQETCAQLEEKLASTIAEAKLGESFLRELEEFQYNMRQELYSRHQKLQRALGAAAVAPSVSAAPTPTPAPAAPVAKASASKARSLHEVKRDIQEKLDELRPSLQRLETYAGGKSSTSKAREWVSRNLHANIGDSMFSSAQDLSLKRRTQATLIISSLNKEVQTLIDLTNKRTDSKAPFDVTTKLDQIRRNVSEKKESDLFKKSSEAMSALTTLEQGLTTLIGELKKLEPEFKTAEQEAERKAAEKKAADAKRADEWQSFLQKPGSGRGRV